MNKSNYVNRDWYNTVAGELDEANAEIEQLKAKVAELENELIITPVAKISHMISDSNDVVLTSFLDVIKGGAGFENISDGTILYMLKSS